MSRSGVLSLLVMTAVVSGVGVWVALDDEDGLPEFLFLSVVLLTLAGVLRLAVRAGRRAAAEHARDSRLAATPETEVAHAAIAVERARLAGDVQTVVRSAAAEMGDAADEAARHWDDDPAPALRDVQRHGAQAGLELRRLLGLLREADDDVATQATAPLALPPRISRGDVVLAAVATMLAVAETLAYRSEFSAQTVGAMSVLLSAGAAATVVLRRAAPELGAVVCGLLFAAGIWTQPLSSGFWLLLGPGALTWGAVARGPRGLLGAGALAAGVGAEMAVQDPDNLLLALLTLAAAAVGSAAVRTSDSWGRTARARADQRAAELATAAATAVRAERLAVARELHDLVSHAVGVMVMQAGAALVTRDGDPERARRALDVVRRTAADAQHELDRLVAVLDSGVLGGAVPPETYDVAALADRMREGGLAVRLELAATPSGEVGAVAYRIVQESLTNVIKHAPRAAAVVRIREVAGDLTIDIEDDGPGPRGAGRSGYGLVGIAERVQRLGGDLTAGPGPASRGFRVHARLPAMAARHP